MATYYTSPNNQRDTAQILYSRENIPTTTTTTTSTTYQDPSVMSSNMMIYMNSSDSYSEALAQQQQQQQQNNNNCLDMPPPPISDSAPHHQNHDILSNIGGFGEWREGNQGLSLSLGTQINSISFRNPNMGFASFLSPQFGDYNNDSKGDLSSSSLPGQYVARAVPSSKYLRAAQQLLDEVVNVRKALKQNETGEKEKEHRTTRSPKEGGGGDDGSKSESTIGESSAGNSLPAPELSHTEKQELQNKLTKLLSMLDEVDRRYKQYYHQMQIVVSSFDAIAGGGSAKPYTALALQTISRHFRCLRDAITGQIKATRKGLGEDDGSGSVKGVGISRLRFVDQQLRQQRALQQLGMMQQHAWRPQRGLPESSVSILRAWLFEHFLHPYPKDTDKIMLARQTGLTRSQVSNWFINARVRLWKPMVEEMYKEETGEADMDSNSSSENAARASKVNEDRVDNSQQQQQQQQQQHQNHHQNHHHQSTSSTGTEPRGQFTEPQKPEMGASGSVGPDYLYPETGMGGFHHSSRDERFMAAAAYHMGGRFAGGPGASSVSLTLGLQHCDGGPNMAIPSGSHQGFVTMRGHDDGDMYGGRPGAPSVGPDGSEYDQPRFVTAVTSSSSSHLLHDFVV